MSQELDIQEIFHKITQPWLTRPDWEGTLQLMDIINESPKRLPAVLVPLITQRLKDTDAKVVWLTLIVLDAFVLHGPSEFADHVATEQFMTLMYKLLKKRWVHRKKNFSVRATYKNWVGELAAHLIREWAVVLGRNQNVQHPMFINTYHTCITEGIRFPEPGTRNELTKMHFPTASVTHTEEKKPARRKSSAGSSSAKQTKQRRSSTPQPVSEVASCVTSANLLTDLIHNTKRGENIKDNEIATEVVAQLKKSLKNISDLVTDNLGNERVVLELLTSFEKGDMALKKYNKSIQGGGRAEPSESESDESSGEIGLFIPTLTPQQQDIFFQQHMQPLISSPQFVTQYGQYTTGSVPSFGTNYTFPRPVPPHGGFGPGLQAIPSSGPLSLSQPPPTLPNPFLTNANPFVTNTPPVDRSNSNPFVTRPRSSSTGSAGSNPFLTTSLGNSAPSPQRTSGLSSPAPGVVNNPFASNPGTSYQ